MANSIKLNKTKKFHFLYKTTNLLNGKYYIGMHSTNNLKDGYLGSGTILRRSIRKYGKENFQFEILQYCDTFDLVKQRESEVVTEESIKDILCMNLKPGGLGGFSNKEHMMKCSLAGAKLGGIAANKVLWAKMKSDPEMFERWRLSLQKTKREQPSFKGMKHSEESKQKMSLALKGKIPWNKGVKHSQETKLKISETLRKKKAGVAKLVER